MSASLTRTVFEGTISHTLSVKDDHRVYAEQVATLNLVDHGKACQGQMRKLPGPIRPTAVGYSIAESPHLRTIKISTLLVPSGEAHNLLILVVFEIIESMP
jgi:hypothetical protein